MAQTHTTIAPKKDAARRARGGALLLIGLEAAQVAAFRAAADGVSIHTAADVRAAAVMLRRVPVKLVVACRDAEATLRCLTDHAPEAKALLLDEQPSVSRSAVAFRSGFIDYFGPTELTDLNLLTERLRQALEAQRLAARNDRRLVRLRQAVRKLNLSRRQVGKRVDALCCDLVTAYGDLARQMDTVRLRQEFGSLLEVSEDLEQLLCHTMDWILKRMGHCNIAIYLADEDGGAELGAYMKYTIAGDKPLTDALVGGLVKQIGRRGTVHTNAVQTSEVLSQAEMPLLQGQAVLGVDCQYLCETLATIVCFRDGHKPFTAADREALECAAGPFAQVLTTLVRDGDFGTDEEAWGGAEPWAEDGDPLDEGDADGPPKKKRKNNDSHAADWWKRGEEPPF